MEFFLFEVLKNIKIILNPQESKNFNHKPANGVPKDPQLLPLDIFLPWGLRPHTPAGGKPPDPQNLNVHEST